MFTIISCLCDMDESSSRPQQSFRRGKGVCYHFRSEIYGLRDQMGIFENGKTKERSRFEVWMCKS